MSSNKNAIKLLKENSNKINWDNLSLNPNAIALLKLNINKINWTNLSANYNAIELLKKIKIKLIGLLYLQIKMQLNY